ncbi:MAG: 5-(carboxyamino)imidazole ribonucleotide synthase [Alphaproteobacteria bacterium]
MLALAAANLGYRTHVLVPEADSPAGQVAAATTVAAYDDAGALDRFAASVDVATYEFENVPAATAERIAGRVALHPSPAVLAIAQDRIEEKRFVRSCGIATADFRPVDDLATLDRAVADLGRPAVLKTTRLGYDGKGQATIRPDGDLDRAFAVLGGRPGILEAFVDFRMEISVIVARGRAGDVAAFVPVENRHVDHILDTTIAPAPIGPALSAEAGRIARTIAERLDLVGLIGVEMFVTRDDRILVNEIAPRPHNSGHWTIDACRTSQFEQHVRAICGLPLGPTERHADAVMTNLIGDGVERWAAALADPAAKLHLYGKREARAGRKMGHVTRLSPRSDR